MLCRAVAPPGVGLDDATGQSPFPAVSTATRRSPASARQPRTPEGHCRVSILFRNTTIRDTPTAGEQKLVALLGQAAPVCFMDFLRLTKPGQYSRERTPPRRRR